MSLEVDGRPGGVPIPYPREDESHKYMSPQAAYETLSNTQNPYAARNNREPTSTQPQQLSKPKDLGQGRRVRMRPWLIVLWGVLFALVSVLAIVAAGVAGSIAAKRGKHIDACMNTLQTLNATLNANDSSPQNSNSTNNSISTADATCQNNNSASFIATSDCSSLASPYTPPTSILGLSTSNNSFNIHCDTDYMQASVDFMSFLAFTFEDCIVACASYNQRVPSLHPNSTCFGVSFDLGVGENEGPNCFLKGVQNLAPTSRPGVSSSALLVVNK